MERKNIAQFKNRFVRLFMKKGIIWTGYILDVDSETTKIEDKFSRLVTVMNEDITTVSEWAIEGGMKNDCRPRFS